MESTFSFSSPAAAAARPTTRSQTKSSLSNQIATPEKSAQSPRFPRGKGVAYSLKQVKKAALGLQSGGRKGSGGGVAIVEKKGLGLKTRRKGVGDLPNRTGDGGASSSSSAAEKVADGQTTPDLARKRATVANLPEKYKLLEEFFKFMVRAIRLLRLKRQLCILSNIAPQIESLTNRRFSHSHLAQFKYLLPEAILVKKFNKLDEATCCMKADLQIDLVVNAFGESMKQKQESGYSFLEKTFRTRLEKFCKDNPEGDDVPEDALPEPFTHKKPTMQAKKTEDMVSTSTSSVFSKASNAVSEEQFVVPSHMPGSFIRLFSQKALRLDKTSLTSHVELESPRAVSSQKRCTFQCPNSQKETSKEIIHCDDFPTKESNVMDGTPAKVLSTPMRLMAATPELKTPNSCTIMDDGLTPVKKRVKRPLLYLGKSNEGENNDTEMDAEEVYDASLGFLPKCLLQSVRVKKRKSMEDQVAGIPEAKRRKKMIACLPKLFDIIHLVFQSARQSVFTRQELVNKVIISHLHVVDKTEVEEQLNLLLELVPEWITGETIFSGDNILRVNKNVSPESMRRRLSEAK